MPLLCHPISCLFKKPSGLPKFSKPTSIGLILCNLTKTFISIVLIQFASFID